MFHPEWLDMEQLGLHHLVNDCLADCEYDMRRELSSNIVLSGGSTLFPGFQERLLKELTPLLRRMKPVIVQPPPTEGVTMSQAQEFAGTCCLYMYVCICMRVYLCVIIVCISL